MGSKYKILTSGGIIAVAVLLLIFTSVQYREQSKLKNATAQALSEEILVLKTIQDEWQNRASWVEQEGVVAQSAYIDAIKRFARKVNQSQFNEAFNADLQQVNSAKDALSSQLNSHVSRVSNANDENFQTNVASSTGSILSSFQSTINTLNQAYLNQQAALEDSSFYYQASLILLSLIIVATLGFLMYQVFSAQDESNSQIINERRKLKAGYNKLKTDHARARQFIKEKEQLLARKENQIREGSQRLSNLTAELEKLKNRVSQLSYEKENLQDKLRDKASEKDRLEIKLEEHQRQIASFNSQNQETSASYQLVQNEIQRLTHQLEQADQELHKARDLAQQQQHLNNEVALENSGLKQQIENAEYQRNLIREQLTEKKEELRELRDKLDQQEASINALKEKLFGLQNRHDALGKNYEDLQDELSTKSDLLEQTQNQLRLKDEEINNLKNLQAQLKNENAELKEQILSYEQIIEEKDTRLQESHLSLNDEKEKVGKLQKELESLKLKHTESVNGQQLSSPIENRSLIWDYDLGAETMVIPNLLLDELGLTMDASNAALKDFYRLFVEEDRAAVAEAFTKVINKQSEKINVEARINQANGKNSWQLLKGNVLTDEHKKPTRITGSITDINQFKEAEELLRDLSLVAEKVENAVMIADNNLKIQWVNKGFEQISGYEINEIESRNVDFLYQHTKADFESLDAFNQNIRSKKAFKTTLSAESKNGKLIWLETSVSPVYDGSGQVEKYLIIQKDITTLKESKQKLQELSLLASKTDDAVAIINKIGLIEWVNEGFVRLFEYSQNEVHNKKINALLSGTQTDPEALAHIQQLCQSKESFKQEIQYQGKSGSTVWVSASYTPIFDKYGAIEKFIIIHDDITAVKQKEQEINETRKELAFIKEQNEVELARIANEQNLELMMEGAPIAICIVNQQGLVEKANDQFCKVFDTTVQLASGKAFTNTVFVENSSDWLIQNKSYIAGQVTLDGMEMSVTNAAGLPLQVMVENIRFKSAGGSWKRAMYFVNLTEKRQLEDEISQARKQIAEYTQELKSSTQKTKGLEEQILEIQELERQNGAKIETIMGSAPIGICVINEDGIVEQANDTYCTLFGVDKNELIDNSFTEVFIPKEASFWQKKFKSQLNGRAELRGDFSVKTKHKGQRFIQMDAQLIEEADGTSRVVKYVIDNTESHRLEQEIKESEEAMRELMEEQFANSEKLMDAEKRLKEALAESENLSLVASKTDNAVIITDKSGSIEWVNEGFTRITEYRLDEVKGKKPGDFLQGEATSQEDVMAIRSGLNSQRPFTHTIYNYSKSGRGYWLELSITPIFNEKGALHKFIAIESDVTEQKEAQSELEKLSLVASQTDNAVIITDKDGKIEWVNEGFTRITEYRMDEVKGKKPGSFLQGEKTSQEDVMAIRAGINSRRPFEHTIYNYSKSGRGYWLQLSITPIFNERGVIDKFIAIESDVTEQKEAQEEMETLSMVASKTDNAVIITDKDGKIMWVNDGFTRITEYTLAEVKGKKPGTFLQGANTRPEDVKKIREGLNSKRPFKHEIYNYSKSGRGYWLSLSITPIFDKDGVIEQFIAIESDITEQKLAQAELENLSLVASKTDNAVIITDKDGKIEWVNEGFTRITEYKLEEVKGRKPGAFLQGENTRPEDVRKIREGLNSKRPFKHEIYNYSKTGRGYWLSLSITPIFGEDGTVDKFVAIESDITEQKIAQSELENLSMVASKTDNAVIVTNKDGLIEWVNEGFTRITEYGLEEVKGKKPGTFLQGPKTTQEDVLAIREGLKSQKPFRHEIYNYSKSGRGYWLQLSITPIFDENGALEKFIAIESDVTEAKKLAEEIRESEEQMRLIMDEQFANSEKLMSAEAKLQEALKESENLSLVASKTDNAVIITNKDGGIEWVNEGFTRITEYTLEEVLGKKPGSFLQGESTSEDDVKAIRAGLDSKKPFKHEIYNYSKSGRGYWLQLSITPILDQEGEVQKFIAIESDITEEKEVQTELENLSMVASKTDNAVIITNKHGLIEWVNEGFSRITEYSFEEVKGRKPGTFLQGEETREEDVLAIRDGLASKKPFKHEIYNYSKSGRGYWLQLSITPIFDENGELEKFIAIESDVTEAKKLAQEIEESEEQMRQIMEEQFAASEALMKKEKELNEVLAEEKRSKEELDRTLARLKEAQQQMVQNEKMASIGQLTAGIAHEINNPINFVYNGIDSLKMSLDDLMMIVNKYNELNEASNGQVKEVLTEVEELKRKLRFNKLLKTLPEVISDIKTGANRTIEIVKGLRVFSRLDEEEQKMANINECLESTLILLRNKTKDKIKVKRYLDDHIDEIMCYPGQLNQVFMNLLNNAVDAIPEDKKDGQLMIYTENLKDSVIIRIMDNGMGIPEDVQKRIFEPFFTTKPVGIGTGLGLSISYGIIEKHEGKIYVNSEVGKGTEFVIELPKENVKKLKTA